MENISLFFVNNKHFSGSLPVGHIRFYVTQKVTGVSKKIGAIDNTCVKRITPGLCNCNFCFN